MTIAGGFEWSDAKAAANLAQHGVSFEEALTAFADPNAYMSDDGSDKGGFVLIGFSGQARLLTVVHAERGERIRIISARRATADEQRLYVEG